MKKGIVIGFDLARPGRDELVGAIWRDGRITRILDEAEVVALYDAPPVALTDQNVAALERAIRAEGYRILVDTDTGEIILEHQGWASMTPAQREGCFGCPNSRVR